MSLFLDKKISISKFYPILFNIVLVITLTGCGGGGGEDNPTGGPPPGGGTGCTTTGIATSSYAISWDDLSDPNNTINAYKIYISSDPQTSKQNAIDSFTVSGIATNNNYIFSPGNYSLQACTTYYFAVATLTTEAGESQLSTPVTIQVD